MSMSDMALSGAGWDEELEALYDRLSGRGSFRWDARSDGLYQAARERAVTDGRLAMRDTMGQAAALTGGYGSSYGQAVGQHSYENYLRSLGEAMPQFYAMARQNWQDEGDALRERYDLTWQRAEAEREREDAAARAAAEAEQNAWKRQQTNYSALVKLIQGSGYRPSDAELAAAGLSRAAAEALAAAYERGLKTTRRGGSGSRKKKTDEAESAAAVAQTQTRTSGGGGGKLLLMTR